MADQTDTFIREVQEDIRREQIAQIWAGYGTYIIAAAVLIVAAVGAYKYAEYQRIHAAESSGTRYEEAVRLAAGGKTEDAQKALDAIIKDAPAGYSALARIRAAGAMAKSGKTAEAVAAYEALSKDGRTDELLRDYAALQIGMLRLDQADWTEMQNRLNDLTNDRNPWRASARELLGLAAYKAGKTDDARKTFVQLLGDRTTPPSMVERAQLMLAVLAESEMSKDRVPNEPDRQTLQETSKPPERSDAAPAKK